MKLRSFEQTLNTEEELILEKLKRWAVDRKDKTFLFYGEENKSFTFHEFHELTNRVAHSLKDKGIKKGDRICVFLNNPLITAIAMFGIWKTGAVFCPINFNYKGKLLSYQINDTTPKTMITERKMIPLINDIQEEISLSEMITHNPGENDHDYHSESAHVKLNDQFKESSFQELTTGNSSDVEIDLNYWDTANVIYTSGTTGPAKGVVQSYRWIHNYTFFFRQFNTQEDVIYNDLPLYHVGGAFALVARAAFVGCKVALWDKFSPNDFWSRIEISGATNAILLDVMIPWLMQAPRAENDHVNTLNRVHMQPLPQYHHEVAKRFGFDFVSAGFGQTESGVAFVSIIDQGKGTPVHLYKGYTREQTLEIAQELKIPVQHGHQPLKKGYMGAVSPFFEASILNDQDDLCEPEQVGQIALRPRFPDLIMDRYFNKPEATLEAFRNLWFHTGDAGYEDKDGNYYFVDRMKDVIRHRGENISSYQVEDVINQHKLVNLCAAFPVPAEEGDEDDIVVYIAAEKELEEKELVNWVKAEMPKFMWPRYIRFTDDFPRTPTNKIEKYKLKKQFREELTEEIQ